MLIHSVTFSLMVLYLFAEAKRSGLSVGGSAQDDSLNIHNGSVNLAEINQHGKRQTASGAICPNAFAVSRWTLDGQNYPPASISYARKNVTAEHNRVVINVQEVGAANIDKQKYVMLEAGDNTTSSMRITGSNPFFNDKQVTYHTVSGCGNLPVRTLSDFLSRLLANQTTISVPLTETSQTNSTTVATYTDTTQSAATTTMTTMATNSKPTRVSKNLPVNTATDPENATDKTATTTAILTENFTEPDMSSGSNNLPLYIGISAGACCVLLVCGAAYLAAKNRAHQPQNSASDELVSATRTYGELNILNNPATVEQNNNNMRTSQYGPFPSASTNVNDPRASDYQSFQDASSHQYHAPPASANTASVGYESSGSGLAF